MLTIWEDLCGALLAADFPPGTVCSVRCVLKVMRRLQNFKSERKLEALIFFGPEAA